MKADLKATDVQGRTPLFVAARGGHQLVVQHLLKHKAKLGINATNKSGRTALMAAYLNDHTEVVQMLLTAGANLWVKDANNKRASEPPYPPAFLSRHFPFPHLFIWDKRLWCEMEGSF